MPLTMEWFLKRKEEVMSKKQTKAPFNNLEEIAARKQELRKQIKRQEKVLAKDFDDYQEDVDTLKHYWQRLVSVRNIRKKANVDGIASGLSSLTGKPGVATAITIGAKVAAWLWKRKKRQ